MDKFLQTISCFALVLFLFSCGGANDAVPTKDEPKEQSKYGGVFKMPIDSYFKKGSINEIKKLEETQIYTQVYEGLVKYNAKTLEIEPCLAVNWEVSEDGMSYLFTLRDDVFFQDNPCFEGGKGRKVDATDVVYSITSIFEPKANNSGYPIFKNTIVGGDEYYEGKADSVSGVYTEGDKVRIDLKHPGSTFLQKMASIFGSIQAKEAVEMSTAEKICFVGTGPFLYDEQSTSEDVRFSRNEKYYEVDEEGNKLPYFDSVKFIYYENLDEQMELFWNGDLTHIPEVPVSKISEVLEERISDFESNPPKYILSSEPELSVSYLEMNMQTPVLKNKKVRQAINLAINREKLVEKIMKNQAYEVGKFGLTPPLSKIFEGYDFEGVEDLGYVYNPEKAKTLLAEAGYPNGKNFPSLDMQFATGRTSYLIMSEIQSQLRSVLNINVDIEAIELNELIANKSLAKADIFRTNWIADFPSAEAFLANAYGKLVPKNRKEPSNLNTARYKNPAFDEVFEKATTALNSKEANKYFSEAEKILMEDPPFVVLWYDEDMTLKLASLQNFESNAIGYLYLSKAYFRTPEAKDYN